MNRSFVTGVQRLFTAFVLMFATAAFAGLQITAQSPTSDGFSGYITNIREVAGQTGSVDVDYYNYTNATWAFKREFCGGDISTYYTESSGQMPSVANGTTYANGLSVTLVYSWGSQRTYRFSGLTVGAANNFCFVSADGYNSSTLVPTQSTPTPFISNLRILDDASVAGGKKLCVDFAPSNPAINSFDWIENGTVKTNGPASALWSSYICWNRTTTLVTGSTYTVQLRYNGSTSVTSNSLSIAVPSTLPLPGAIATASATNLDASIPGQIRVTWTASSNATSYNVYRSDIGYIAMNVSGLTYLDTPALTTYQLYAIQGVNATGTGPWYAWATGTAAPVPAPTCTSQSVSASVVPSSAATVRVSMNGVINATSVYFPTWGVINGQNDVVNWQGVNGGGGYWYADVLLNSLPHSPEFGAFMVGSYMNGPGGNGVVCSAPATAFVRREQQNATVVSRSVAGVSNPTVLTLLAGRAYPVSVTLTNTGQSTWQHATSVAANSGHKLGTQNPVNNATFGFSRLLMGGISTAPGATATAAGSLSGTVGTFNLQLQSTEEGLEWFGATTPNVPITFVASPTSASGINATDGTLGDRVRVTWTAGANASVQNVLRATAGTPWPVGTLTGIPASWSNVCPNLSANVTTCDDLTAQPGTTYVYRVFSISGADGSSANGWDQGAVSVGDTGFRPSPLTTAPVITNVSSNSASGITITWLSYSGASSFEVQRMLEDEVGTQDGLLTVNDGQLTSTFDTGTARGAHRCYAMRALNIAGPSPWSNTLCGERVGFTAPTLLASQGTVTGATRLTWAAPSGYTAVTTEIWRRSFYDGAYIWTRLVVLSGSPGAWDDTSPVGAALSVKFYRLHQLDAAGNSTYWYMTNESNHSANIASGYANLAPTAIAIPAINAVSNAATSPVNLTVTDPNAMAGQPESFTWTASNPTTGSTAGSCTILSGSMLQWQPPTEQSFSGSRTCVVTVTDRGGAILSASATFNVQAYVPGAPTGMSATDGTVTGAVALTWNAIAGTTYQVFKYGAQIATAATNAFSDATVVSVTAYGYSVRAVSASGGVSPMSAVDVGYANSAPTSATASINLANASPNATASVLPTVVDPNSTAGQTETFVYAINAPLPANRGVVSVVNGRLEYAAPSVITFAGPQTFGYSVTDKGGAVLNATGTVNMPTFDKATVLSTTPPEASIKAAVGAPLSLSVNYRNDGNTTWATTGYAFTVLAPANSGIAAAPAAIPAEGVAPGQSVTLTASIAPANVGTYDVAYGIANTNVSASPFAAASTLRLHVVAPVDCSTASAFTQTSVVTAITGSLGVAAANVVGADRLWFRVAGLANGDNDVHDYEASLTNNTWLANIDLSKHAIGAPEFGDFKVEAYVAKAPYADKVCATSTFRREFPSPANVSATQGTLTGKVQITWDAIPTVMGVSPSGYSILRCASSIAAPAYGSSRALPAGCVLAGTAPANGITFEDFPADVSEVRYGYAVAAHEGPLSAAVIGWLNLPPTGATWQATVSLHGTALNLPLPVGNDPNPTDTLTFSLTNPPVPNDSTTTVQNATISRTANGGFVYTPPPAASLPTVEPTTDSVTFYVYDKVGAVTQANATFTVCPMPSVANVTASAAATISATGSVGRMTCNGSVSLGWSAIRVGNSATAGATQTTAPSTVNVADTTRINVTGNTFSTTVPLSSALTTISGLYELRANVRDAFGASAESAPVVVDLPCGSPLLSFGSVQPNHKLSTVSVSTTVRETDDCQRGATYRMRTTTPTSDGSIVSADARVQGATSATTTTYDLAAALNTNLATTWIADIVRSSGALRQAELIGFNSTRELSRYAAPLVITCPGNQLLGGDLWAQSNQAIITLNVALPLCAPDEVFSIVVDGQEFSAQPRDANLLSATRVATLAFEVPMPAADGARNVLVKRSPIAGGSPTSQSMTVVYDARSVTPLYGVAGASATGTVNSLGRLILVPRTQ